jgi:hypothetical protein
VLVLVLGLALMRSGAARARLRRQESKKFRKLAAEQRDTDAARQRTDDRAAVNQDPPAPAS